MRGRQGKWDREGRIMRQREGERKGWGREGRRQETLLWSPDVSLVLY